MKIKSWIFAQFFDDIGVVVFSTELKSSTLVDQFEFRWLVGFSTTLDTTSRLYHSLEWYTRVYTTPDYDITYLFPDRRDMVNMGLRTVR